MAVTVPVSWGELIDKITILELKSERLSDRTKLENVRRELAMLTAIVDREHADHAALKALTAKLREVNAALWVIEDDIRDKERAQAFDARFIELARAVYIENDERAAIKKRINVKLGSRIVEEKSYKPYKPA